MVSGGGFAPPLHLHSSVKTVAQGSANRSVCVLFDSCNKKRIFFFCCLKVLLLTQTFLDRRGLAYRSATTAVGTGFVEALRRSLSLGRGSISTFGSGSQTANTTLAFLQHICNDLALPPPRLRHKDTSAGSAESPSKTLCVLLSCTEPHQRKHGVFMTCCIHGCKLSSSP